MRTLNEKAAIAARATGNYLLQCLKSRCPEADEAAFVDGIGRSLSAGDFLLLIVGDGIRYGAESLVAFGTLWKLALRPKPYRDRGLPIARWADTAATASPGED